MSYKPDYGLRQMNDGISKNVDLSFYDFPLYSLTVLDRGQYSTTVEMRFAGELHALSLDFNQKQLDQILSKASPQIVAFLRKELANDPCTPRTLDFEGQVVFGVRARLGELQKLPHESFVPLVAQEIMLDETASSKHYAGTKIRTDQLKTGARVRMRNGLEAIVVKECDGNTLIAKVFGASNETGSVYAHNIVATEVDGQWIEVEMTEDQARFYKEVKPFFDGNINIDTI